MKRPFLNNFYPVLLFIFVLSCNVTDKDAEPDPVVIDDGGNEVNILLDITILTTTNINGDHVPLDYVNVEIDGERFQANSKGEIKLSGLAYDRYTIRAYRGEYYDLNTYLYISADSPNEFTLELEPEEGFEPFIEIGKAALKTKVLYQDENGFNQPLTDAYVGLDGVYYITDSEGNLNLNDLTRYGSGVSLIVTKDGYDTVETSVNLQLGELTETTVRLTDRLYTEDSYVGYVDPFYNIIEVLPYDLGVRRLIDASLLVNGMPSPHDPRSVKEGRVEISVRKDFYSSVDSSIALIGDENKQKIVKVILKTGKAALRFRVLGLNGGSVIDLVHSSVTVNGEILEHIGRDYPINSPKYHQIIDVEPGPLNVSISSPTFETLNFVIDTQPGEIIDQSYELVKIAQDEPAEMFPLELGNTWKYELVSGVWDRCSAAEDPSTMYLYEDFIEEVEIVDVQQRSDQMVYIFSQRIYGDYDRGSDGIGSIDTTGTFKVFEEMSSSELTYDSSGNVIKILSFLGAGMNFPLGPAIRNDLIKDPNDQVFRYMNWGDLIDNEIFHREFTFAQIDRAKVNQGVYWSRRVESTKWDCTFAYKTLIEFNGEAVE